MEAWIHFNESVRNSAWISGGQAHVHLLDSISSGLWSYPIVDSQSVNILMSITALRFILKIFISAVSVCCMLPRLSCLLTRHNDVMDAGKNNRLYALGTDMDRALYCVSLTHDKGYVSRTNM